MLYFIISSLTCCAMNVRLAFVITRTCVLNLEGFEKWNAIFTFGHISYAIFPEPFNVIIVLFLLCVNIYKDPSKFEFQSQLRKALSLSFNSDNSSSVFPLDLFPPISPYIIIIIILTQMSPEIHPPKISHH